MYRLLLADDETATREGILEAINWRELGIGEVQSAKNGIAALEIAAEFVPDILLTDIKMPRMNGIDLAYKIRELNPDCSILIMSGYSEVDYLKSAIHLSAVNFVDKPVEIEKLAQWVRKCVEVQEGISRNKANAENRRLFLLSETALGLMRNEVDQPIRYLNELYPGFHPSSRCLCMLMRLFPAQFRDDGEKADMAKITDMVVKVLEGFSFQYALGAIHDNTLGIFVFLSSSDAWEEVLNKVYEGIKAVSEPYELFMGCGEPSENLYCVARSCETARLALDKSFYSKQKRFLRYQQPSTAIKPEEFAKHAEMFSEHIRSGNKAEALKLLDGITFQISMHSGTRTDRVVDFYLQLILEMLRQKTVSFSEDSEQMNIHNRVIGCSFLEDIENYTVQFIQDYFDEIYRKNSSSEIEQVLSIIRQQYGMKKLSLADISRQTFRSPSYICVKFREATGKTFTQYLSEYRVEESLKLLRDKSLKIAYIAEKVGFDNGNYFSKIFFKLKGITPLEYRKRFLSGAQFHDGT